MDSANAVLPDLDGLSIAELKALVYEQHAQLHTHKLQIERLNLLIARLRRVQFGRKSEKLAQRIGQLELWAEELEADAQLGEALILRRHHHVLRHRRRAGGRRAGAALNLDQA